MYKVMLVDDEKLITKGLLNILEWDKLGVEVVEIAENGQDAFDKFNSNPVDIVITDINMPKVSGLELIKKIKEVNSKVKFIILSGYDEFSYARTAIQYGVENYILKPINEEELEEAIINITNNIKEHKKEERVILEKNNILNELINGKIKKEDIKEFISIDLNAQSYSVAIISITSRCKTKSLVDISIIIEDNIQGKYELIKKTDGTIVMINTWQEEKSREEIKDYYYNIKNKLIEESDLEIFIAIGDRVNNIESLKESYIVASNVKKYSLTEGTNIVLDKEDIRNLEGDNRSFTKEIDRLNKLIIEKDIVKIKEYVTKLFDDEKLTPKNIYDLSIKILFLTAKTSEEFKLDNKYSRHSLGDTILELCNENSIDNIKLFIINELEEMTILMNSNVVKYSPIIQQIVNNVNEKYYEELSLKTLAYQYNINSSYLGQVFTKEVGISFSEYLNKTKNAKAKDFILNTNMKINDIAKAVGYLDTSYFYRKFKKYYGVCPSTLRELKNY